MLAPFPVARRQIVNAGQKLKLVQRHLLRLDAQLVILFPLRRPLDAHDRRVELGARLAGDAERV